MDYDVVIIGGGIAGSVAAKFCAKNNFKTLLVERYKTPRNKPCSGIQFPYFEKMLGEKIPKERLCNIELDKVRVYLPDGKNFGSPFKMLNFMRKPFDDWLNIVAQQNGAEFLDQCSFQDYEKEGELYKVKLLKGDSEQLNFTAKYLIDGSGMRSSIRRKLRPQDYVGKSFGATLNYYIDGETDFDPKTLYQFWNLEWNNAMFAWVYTKTLDDGKDYWVIGTGYNGGDIKEKQELFYQHVKDKFNVDGTIVQREGFSSSLDIYSQDRIFLGEGNLLLAGDSAGLVDQVRGVGMDSAALSGRLAAQAIDNTENGGGKDVQHEYAKLLKIVLKQTRKNQSREINEFKTNEELQKYIQKNMAVTGIKMFIEDKLNRFRKVEKMRLLPP